MVTIQSERTIPAPAARVWEVIASADRLPEWYARSDKVEVLEGAGLGRRQRISSTWRGQDSEVDQIISWLTGYGQKELEAQLEQGTDFETFFAKAPKINPSRALITGVVCGVRVE